MMPCCELTYIQYLNEDGSLNLDEYWKMISYLRTDDLSLFNSLYASDLLKPENLCKCECHVIGSMLIH